MDSVEKLIERHLKEKTAADDAIYGAHDYYRYVAGEMKDGEEAAFVRYLASNKDAQDVVLMAQALLRETPKAYPQVPLEWKKGVQKKTVPAGWPGQFWAGVWFFLMFVMFTLSFMVHRYFMQFLAAALLCGIKAMLDYKAAKTQILIYKAMESGERSPQSRIKDLK